MVVFNVGFEGNVEIQGGGSLWGFHTKKSFKSLSGAKRFAKKSGLCKNDMFEIQARDEENSFLASWHFLNGRFVRM